MLEQNKFTGGKTEDTKLNFGKKGWGIVLLGMFAFAMYMGFDTGLNYIVPAFSEKLEVGKTTLFMFSTIGGWVSVLALLIFGAIMKKIGIKSVLIFSMILFCIAAISWAFSNSVAMYGASVIIVKAMGCVICSLGFAEIGANWFPTKKGNYMGIITVGVVIGGFLGNAVMGNVILKAGVTQGIMVFAILSIIMLILSIITIKANPEDAGAFPDNNKNMTREKALELLEKGRSYQKISPWSMKKVLTTPKTWLIGIAFGLVLCVAQGVISQVTSITESYGLDPMVAMLINTIGALFALVSTIVAGKLDQKIGTKMISLFAVSFAILGCLIAGFFGHSSVGMFIGIWCIFAAMSAVNNMIMSFTATLWGRFDFSRPYLVIITIASLISAFGYVLISFIADLKDGNYFYSLLFGAIATIVALVILLFTSDKYIGVENEELEKMMN